MKKIILYILLFFTAAKVFGSNDPTFTMSAPKIVSVGEQFSLTLSLNARGEDLQMPELSDFHILMGPSVSSSRSFQSINGKMTQSVNYSYTFILQAKAEGIYTIPPAAIKAGRKMIQSNSIKIEVIQGRKQTPSNQNQQSQTQSNTNTEISSDDNLFIRFETDKTNVYKGEAIVATFKLYSRVPLSVADQSLPSFEGFWTQNIEIPQAEQTRTQEAVNGLIYNVYTLQKKVLIPQQTGTLYIEPAEMTFDIQQRVRPQSIFDDMFGSTRTIRANKKTKRITINVKKLPPAPAAFNGAVGNFTLTSTIDKTSIAANEAITLQTKVSGNGNLRHISPLEFTFPPDFEVYDPRTSYQIKAGDKGISGSTSFEQVLIPRFAGDFSIPSCPFVYFDPNTKTYKTLNTKKFNITVDRGNEDQSTTVVSARSKEDIRLIGEDIRYINQTDTELNEINSHFFRSLRFYLSYAIAFIVFALIVLLQKKRMRQNANIALMRNKKASRIARKQLKTAAQCLKNKQTEEFFEALSKAFWGYLSDKLTMPLSELNRDNARSTLQDAQVENQTIDEFIHIIDTCEMARFASSAITESIDDLYKKSEKLFGQFEKQIRKKL